MACVPTGCNNVLTALRGRGATTAARWVPSVVSLRADASGSTRGPDGEATVALDNGRLALAIRNVGYSNGRRRSEVAVRLMKQRQSSPQRRAGQTLSLRHRLSPGLA